MPEFRDCAVICIPDDNWGEMVCAVIVPVEPSFDDAQTIVEAGKKALGPVKAPKSVHFVQALPSPAVGKVDMKDRNAVVSGKNVSVRVNLGGRRSIQKIKRHITMTRITD